VANDQIRLETRISAPPETVWSILTEPEHIQTWWAFDGAEVDLRPGGAMLFRWTEHGEFRSVIKTVERDRRFVFQMSSNPGKAPEPGGQTLVEFTLISESGGTQLNFMESGFSGLEGTEEEVAQSAVISKQGWTGGLAVLKELAEKQNG